MIERWQPGTMLAPHSVSAERRNPDQVDFESALDESARLVETTRAPAEVPEPLEGAESDTAAVVIESITDQAGAVVEATLLPWQLTSQGVLSQMSQGLLVGAMAMRMRGEGDLSGGQTLGRVAAAQSVQMDAVPSATQFPLSPIQGTQLMEARYSTQKSKGSDPTGARLASLASPWPDRLVRWIVGAGEDVTAWVRDYRLTDRDIPDLVEQLIRHSESNGVPLGRIVVNGHEQWCATHSNRQEIR